MKNKCLPALGLAISFIASLSISASSMAQNAVNVPSAAEAGRASEQIEAPARERSDETRRIRTESTLDSGAPEGAENIIFTLRSIRFTGQSNETLANLDTSYKGLYGKEISLKKLYEIAASLTREYRNEGYILSRVIVPPQTIDDGYVTLQIVEGFIDNVSILEDGDGSLQRSYHGRVYKLVENYLNEALQERPLNIKKLERGLLLIDDLAGIAARSVLSPSQRTAQASDLQIILSRQKIESLVSIDNHGSRYLGPLQGIAQTQLSSLFGWGESINLQAAYAPDSDLARNLIFGAVQFDLPLMTQGFTWSTGASFSESKPGYILDEFEVIGNSSNIFSKVSYSFIRQRDFNLAGDIQIDLQKVESDNNIDAPDRDNLTTARIGVNFDWQDNWLFNAITFGRVQVSKGLKLFGASRRGDTDITRPDANPQATKVNLNLARYIQPANSFRFLVGFNAQYATNGLLSSEEFGVGGSTLGRGYDSSEVIGDHGISGQVEAQYFHDGSFLNSDQWQSFLFYDAGRVWNIDAVNSDEKKNSITSAGIGVRTDWNNDISGELTLAVPLTRDVQSRTDKSPRVLFRVSKGF